MLSPAQKRGLTALAIPAVEISPASPFPIDGEVGPKKGKKSSHSGGKVLIIKQSLVSHCFTQSIPRRKSKAC
jgi:hypothetical protein